VNRNHANRQRRGGCFVWVLPQNGAILRDVIAEVRVAEQGRQRRRRRANTGRRHVRGLRDSV